MRSSVAVLAVLALASFACKSTDVASPPSPNPTSPITATHRQQTLRGTILEAAGPGQVRSAYNIVFVSIDGDSVTLRGPIAEIAARELTGIELWVSGYEIGRNQLYVESFTTQDDSSSVCSSRDVTPGCRQQRRAVR